MRIAKMAAKGSLYALILAAAWMTLFLGTTLAAPSAQARSITYDLDIPPQNLRDALQAFAIASQHKLLYSSELVDGKKSPELRGRFTTEQAVKTLLSGTNLSYEVTSDGLLLIRSEGQPSPASSASAANGDSSSGANSSAQEGKKSSSSEFRVAQTNLGSVQNTATVVTPSQSSPSNQNSGLALTEIVVTAQKRQERLIDVPISIDNLNTEELQKRNITSMDDLTMAVPGLAIQSSGAMQRRIFLRGVSNTDGDSPLIGVYLDEADVTTGPYTQLDLRVFDLDRVEVLRGPQGTLYGEGSMGGTIRLITKNPQLDRFTFDSDVAALFTQDGAPSQRIQGVVNVPLVENQLGLRIAGTFDHEGGWMNQPAADVKNFNQQNIADVRIKGLWQPTQQFVVNATALIHRNDGAPNNGEDANGNFTQTLGFTTTPSVTDDFDVYDLTLAYDFGSMRILSTSSYIDQNKDGRNLASEFQLVSPSLPSPQNAIDEDHIVSQVDSSRIFNEELRLSSEGAGPWQWTMGGFYRHAKIAENLAYFFQTLGPPLPQLPYTYPSGTLYKSTSAFVNTSYDVTDQFTLGAGVRYFDDHQTLLVADQKGTFHSVDPRAYAQYKISSDVATYVSAAKGFRSGGFNPGEQNYGPEQVWTYELGTKMFLRGSGLSIDAALYYSNYTDFQTVGLVLLPNGQPVNDTVNVGSARIKGIELALNWRPNDQWDLGFNGNYATSRFYKINAAPTTTEYYVGDPLGLVPKYAYTISAERDFNWIGKASFVRLDYNVHGRETYENRSIGPWFIYQSDVIKMLNAKVGIHVNANLTLSLFAENLLNDRGFADPYGGVGLGSRPRPRTLGLQFGAKFD